MLKSLKRMISAMLIIVLFLTLIPPLQKTVYAAPNLEILFWKVDRNQPADPSMVTTQRVDVEFNYTQVAAEDMPNLYYEITEVNSGVTNVVKDNPAIVSGTQSAVFRDVELKEGLNKITVILDTVSKPQSLPAWINFTAVATISDLKIDDQTFVNGIFVPEMNPILDQNSVFIDGVAPNTTEVTGYTSLNPGGTRANFFLPETGDFSFSAGETNVDLRLRPGDNDLSIIGSNPFKTYRSERTFVYNNGRSFLFNTQVNESASSELVAPTESMLFRQPTFEASGTTGPFNMDITTDLKLNRSNANLTHNRVQFEINNSSTDYDVILSDLDEAAKTVEYRIAVPGVTQVTGFDATANNQSVDLEWEESTATDFSHYEIFYVQANDSTLTKDTAGAVSTTILDAAVTSTSITGLTNGQDYTFVIYAVDQEDGYSPVSTRETVTPMAYSNTIVTDDAAFSGWVTAENQFSTTTTSSAHQSYISWDADNLYVAMEGSELTTANRSVVIYLGGENGTLSGKSFFAGAEQGEHTLPFDSKYVIEVPITADPDADKTAMQFNGTAWGNYNALNTDTDFKADALANTWVEVTIPRDQVGLKNAVPTEDPLLQMAMFVVDETIGSEQTLMLSPARLLEDADLIQHIPTIPYYFEFDLNQNHHPVKQYDKEIQGFAAEPRNQSVNLTWDAIKATNFGKYEIYMNGTEVAEITDQTQTSYLVSGLTNGTSYSFDIRFVDDLDFAGTLVNATATPVTGPPAGNLLNIQVKDDYYILEDFVLEQVSLDRTQSEQLLEVKFLPAAGFNEEIQEFLFYYVNELDPYIKQVKFEDTDTVLFSGIEVAISLESINFIVETANNADGVHAYLESSNIPIGTQSTSGLNAGEFRISLDKNDMPEGRSLIRFVPYTDAEGEFPVGAREYLINYNPAPYVYLKNVSNGQIFNSNVNEPRGINADGTNLNGPVLQITPVNITQSQYEDIRISINDNVDKIRTEDMYPNATNPTEFRYYFGTVAAPTNREGTGWRLHNGLNEVLIEVYPQGSLDADGNPVGNIEPTTTFKYELFYFTDDLPEVTKLDIEANHLANFNFHKVEGEDYRYYTQESSMRFESSVFNAETVNITVDRFDAAGSPVRHEAILRWNPGTRTFIEQSDPNNIIAERITDNGVTGTPDNGRGKIVSGSLDLLGTGTNIISVTVINSSGITSSKILEIVREPASFVVHYPKIDNDTKIGTINGNYTRIYMEAEGATQVIYGKNQIVSKTKPTWINGEMRDLFIFEIKGLKKGNNNIDLTIMRGTQEEEAEITLVNADTAVVGAEFKESISKSRIRAFNNQFELSFPKGTILMKNDPSAADQALSISRDILVGIADPVDGRVNKTLHPIGNESSKFMRKSEWETRYLLLREPTNRFRAVSPMYWVDGGSVPLSGSSQGDILYGSGVYPYERDQEFYTKNASNVNNQFIPSQPGELTLSYDPNMVNSAWRYITVYHYGYNEDYLGNRRYEWKNIGGTVDQKKNTITVPMQEFGYYVVMYMDQSFDDIIGHPWARNSLDTLYSKGIMRPKETTRFETNEPITRGEFTSLIVKAFEIPLNYEGRSTFTDVRIIDPSSYGLYEYKYIETAARASIVRGLLGNRFSPTSSITREDAAVIIARAANLDLDTDLTKIRRSLDKLFTDTNNMSDYAMSSVLAVVDDDLMSGKPNVLQSSNDETFYFDPKANMTRAEASQVMMRVLLEAKKIPNL